MYKELNIRGALLDKNQLSKYIEKVASEHNVKNSSNKETYPIPTLIKNYKFILETYKLLSKHIKLGIKMHSAGEWLLDNFYIIEENVKLIEKEITLKKYRKMLGIANGRHAGFSRCYVLAEEIIAFTDCKLDRETIDIALNSYQRKKLLSMEEICNIGIFFKISIISHIKEICEEIYSSQIQKFKVESIIEKTIETVENKKRIFTGNQNFKNLNDNKRKYPFIEYMSYKLKKYGKKAIIYQGILEKEVLKLGLTVSDVIQKEHFYIANLKIIIGNCIKSIKDINRISFSEMFSYINASEEILKLDPSGIYSLMDQESKNYYRNIIEEISKKSKISEIYITEKIIELCKRYANYNSVIEHKKSHVGYYLIDKGITELKNALEIKSYNLKTDKVKLYVACNVLMPIYICFLFYSFFYIKTNNIYLSALASCILYIPISEIFLKTLNYIMGKIKTPTLIPKMNYENGIPENAKTFVIIPTILKSKEKVKEMFQKLEVYYLANKSDNIFFALLGDSSEEQVPTKDFDEEVMKTGIELAKELNEKYVAENFNRFHFLYRKREWNEGEKSYIGWERKRGLLVNFNEYVKQKNDKLKNNKYENVFLVNTLDKNTKTETNIIHTMPQIKYIITLDSDTNLNLGSASKLIGAMSHILNIPIIENGVVSDGYGMMQPRVGMDLSLSKKTTFIELYSMQGGIDCYTNAISDIYQDYFKEGIFTGKGIYDVETYSKVLGTEIPENTVLSHDLIEGNFLRCGLLTDIMLLDGYPLRYIPYILRNHRWVRGDWQIISWLKSTKLNILSKFKIYDNLRRSLLNIFGFIGIILGSIDVFGNTKVSYTILLISVLSITISYILDIINYIVFKQSNIEGAVYAHKKFSKDLNNITISAIRCVFSIVFLPYEMYKNLDSIIKTIYRMKYRTKLLEWVTAEDGEKNSKTDLNSYYIEMRINILLGVIAFLFRNTFMNILGFLWVIGPSVAWYISLLKNKKSVLKDKDKKYLEEIGRRTWEFFEHHITKENNYLITDNYQEDRLRKIVDRTSSTNIGLELLAIISAYDLGYIKYKQAIEYISKIIEVINSLSKWNGHLYNWYNTKTLEPLIPIYVSTVDSGNLIGYLYIVKQFLIENKNKYDMHDTQNLIINVINIINNADFSELYSRRDRLLSIGYSLEENELTDSCYDFLASEARQASLVAIAKGDIPAKHWNNLSRTLTSLKKYKGLISWTGTAFEYLMPNINLKRYTGSLLDESSKFAVLSQIEYCRKLGVPWGVSESGFNLRDLNNNYQYKAFGIPWLGLKRGLEEDIVVSPYSTFLSLQDELNKGINNLKILEEHGALGKYGFYEAVDYTPSRLKNNRKREIVKSYMAHHQGLILLSVNNIINDNILQKRFNRNPEIEAVDILLQERMPIKMIITKEKKEKIARNKSLADSGYTERIIKNPSKIFKNVNVISNEKYRIIIDDFGNSVSEFEGKIINNYKETGEIKQGIFFYIKNTKTKQILRVEENTTVTFAPDKVKFSKTEKNLKIETTALVDPNKAIEIRRVEIENLGNSEEVLEVIGEFEPAITYKRQEYAHPVFNKLFLKMNVQKENIIVERMDRRLREEVYLGATLYTENEEIVDFEYEIDKEKYYGRENIGLPQMVKNHKVFSKNISQVTDPIISMKRTLKIVPKGKLAVNLIISVSDNKEEVNQLLENMKSEEEIIRTMSIAKARSEEESKYLQITSEKIEIYQRLLSYVLKLNPIKRVKNNNEYSKNSIWKYGISGDNPIILVNIKNIEDIYVVEEVISCFEYYRAKSIFTDLILLNDESNVYERFIKENINEVISNKQLEYLKNINGGIFIINKNEMLKEDLDTIEFMARITINAENGSLQTHLKEMEEKIQSVNNGFEKGKQTDGEEEIIPLNKTELLYDNEFGGFSLDGKEYLIFKNKDNKLPSVWCNILANNFFGSLITDNLGGYTWYRNSRLNRLTAWNNNPVLDLPSEIIYIKDKDNGKIWTLNTGVRPNNNYYYITHGFGYSKFKNINDNFLQELNFFVPNDESLKVINFRIKNIINEERRIKLLYYIKPVMGEDEYLTNGNLKLEKEGNIIFIKNVLADEDFKERTMYVSGNVDIGSFTGEKESFFGDGDIAEPDALYKRLNNNSGLGKNSCVGIELNLDFAKFEDKYFSLVMGEESNKEKIKEIVNKYNENTHAEQKLEEVKQKWKNVLNVINVKTPSESINILINGWAVYQTISSRILSRTGYYQSGGAYGFRDQLQDALGIKYIDSRFLKEQIINCARHQFLEGDVLHWWHLETKRGVRTKFSDDLLWMVYGVIEYIKFENDMSILEEQAPYLKGELLREHEDELYDIYYESGIKENIFSHCVRAIENVVNKGIDSFPKIGIGDWNDGFSNIGSKGDGESVWLAFFLYDVLNKFIPICELKGRKDLSEKYTNINEKLKKALNRKRMGW